MKILVIGDSCIDKYVYGQCDRLCPEAPVPIIQPLYSKTFDGMAHNVYNNLLALKVECDIITNQTKTTKTRIVDDRTNQMIVRIDELEQNKQSLDIKNIDFSQYNGVIVSDYNKGFVSESDLIHISTKSQLSFIDSKRLLNDWINDFSFIKVNEQEYEQSKSFIDQHILYKTIITLGKNGCLFQNVKYPPSNILVTVDTSGAGDTFIATFAYQYIKTNSIFTAIDFAQESCIKVISQRGTATI